LAELLRGLELRVGHYRNAPSLSTRLENTFAWIRWRTSSASSKTLARSSTTSAGRWSTAIGSSNSIRPRDGGGVAPDGPSSADVGVIGKYGAPVRRATSGSSPIFG